MREEPGRRKRGNKLEKRRGYSFNRKTKPQLVKRVIMVMTAKEALDKAEAAKVDHSIGGRGNGGGNRNTPTRGDSPWPPLGNYNPADIRAAFRPNITGLRPLPIAANKKNRQAPHLDGGVKFKGEEEISKM